MYGHRMNKFLLNVCLSNKDEAEDNKYMLNNTC